MIALVAAAALALAAAGAVRGTIVDGETREQLQAAVAAEHSVIDRLAVAGAGVTAAHQVAANCVTRVSDRLAEVADGDPKLPNGSVELAAEVVEAAAHAAPPRTFAAHRPTVPPADAGVDELRAAIVVVADSRQNVVQSVEAAAAAALDAAAECAEARLVMSAFVDGVRTRTDELLAANPKASTETIAALRAAQVAVAVGDAGAATRWAAAVVATEASHAAVVQAEAEAARVAAEAAQREADEWAAEERTADFGSQFNTDPGQFVFKCRAFCELLGLPYG